ncbi:MAG: histidine triad nucleotide-binding protein [bacterium]
MTSCIFCKIINKEISAEVIHEDDGLIVLNDINPKARIHILIIPKKHISSIANAREEDIALLGRCLFQAKLIARKKEINETGYKIVINTGSDGGQIVPHLHIHLLGGEKLSGNNLV